jgi:beta-phosphoglucomutase-like phosphatase (HAD superfamily)
MRLGDDLVVLSDLDGTLIDSSASVVAAFVRSSPEAL